MICRTLLACFLLLACAWCGAPAQAAETSGTKPNIIFILVDDVGCDRYSCYGSDTKTPNVDRLAAQGVLFKNAWCTPLCTPTRVEFLTGRYPYHSGWTVHHDVPRWGGVGFDPEKFTCIARVLKQAGYATGITGKWQINDLRQDKQIMQKHGFDEYCLWTGVEKGNDASEHRYWNAFLEINGERSTHKGEFGPAVTQQFALKFMEDHKQGPFFLYYPMIIMHAPLEAPPELDGKAAGEAGGDKKRGSVDNRLIAYLDHQVGEITAKLAALGIADNTVLVFAGDNGSAGGGGTLDGERTPGAKGKVSDLGVHVPLIVRAPMVAKSALTTAALADFTDLYPTFAELAGAKVPATAELDGRSLVPVLSGQATESKPWIFSQLGSGRILRDERWLLHGSGEFFDLQKDPLEKHDLSRSTEPEVVAAREKLSKVLAGLPANGPPPFEGYRGGDGAIHPKKK